MTFLRRVDALKEESIVQLPLQYVMKYSTRASNLHNLADLSFEDCKNQLQAPQSVVGDC